MYPMYNPEIVAGRTVWAATVVGNRIVFAVSIYRAWGMASEIWSFDGIQFYRHAILPFHIHGLTFCKGRLYVSANAWMNIGDDPPILATSRAFLVEFSMDILNHYDLPPRFYRIWVNQTIGVNGLYSDEEYIDGYAYWPGTETLTTGYDKKLYT
jgi:hypothetical protein